MRQTREAIGTAYALSATLPFSRRRAIDDNPFLREVVVSFRNAGCVPMFKIADETSVTVATDRAQCEKDVLRIDGRAWWQRRGRPRSARQAVG